MSPAFYELSLLFVDAIDEEDRNILARKAAERITFSAEEDSWVTVKCFQYYTHEKQTTL